MKHLICKAVFFASLTVPALAQRGPVLFDNHFNEGVRVRISYVVNGNGFYQSWHFNPGEDPKTPCKCDDMCGQEFVATGDSMVQLQTDSGIRTAAYRLDQAGRWDGNHWDLDYRGSIEEMARGAQPGYFPNFRVGSLRYANQVWSAQAPRGPQVAPLPPGKTGYTRPDGTRVITDMPSVQLPPQNAANQETGIPILPMPKPMVEPQILER